MKAWLEGMVVWVTGAGEGLGRAIAAALMGEAAAVVATSRSAADRHRLRSEDPSGSAIVATGSVSDERGSSASFSRLPAGESGRLHGLVNSAGFSPSFVRSKLLGVQTFHHVLATNTRWRVRGHAASC